MRLFLLTALSIFGILLSAGETNAVMNGDFKLGTAGFGLWRLLRPDVNPDLEYRPLTVENGKLVLENSRGEYFQLRSAEFPLPAGREIRFSTSFQGPSGILDFTILHITASGKWLTHRRTVRSTGKPQTLEFTFNTGKHAGPYMLVVYSSVPATPEGVYRFDYFRISGGERNAEITAACYVEKTLYTLDEEKSAGLRFVLNNSASETSSGKLEFTVLDPGLKKVVFRKEEVVKLAPGTSVRKFSVPLVRFGMFAAAVRWNGNEIPVLGGVFSVIGKYAGKPFIDPAREFVVSVNGGLGFIEKRGNSRGGFEAPGISPVKKYELLQRMGCRLLRDWDSGKLATDWRAMEPENGRFDFSNFDLSVNTARRYGMQIMPVFGRMYENWRPYQAEFRPEWLRRKLIRIEKNPPGTHPKFIVRVPPMPEWERYIAAFARHAGERVSIYEIMNEPNLNMSPELYLKYMIPASGILKRHAPHATVIGICATGDMGKDVGGFMRECVRLGAENYLDGISFHPYSARTLNSMIPADRQIEQIRSMAGDKPLYNTELYYLYDWDDLLDNAGQSSFLRAHHVAQRFLTDLGEGLKQSCSAHMKSLWKQTLHPAYAAYQRTESIPNDVFVAYNALARLFEGAQPVKKLRLSHDVICYIYRRNGKPIAAIWNYSGKKSVADLSAFQVKDIFGNPEEAGEKLISADPLYLAPGKLSEAEFLALLEALPLRLSQPVFGAPLARRVGNSLYVMLHNESDKMQEGVIGIAGGGLSAVSPVRFSLPAKSSRTFDVPVKDVKNNRKAAELMLFLNGSTFRSPIQIVRNKRIGKTFRMKNAEGKLAFDDKKIVLEMNVKDSTDAGLSGERPPWKTDCVELFFDTDPLHIPLKFPQAYTHNTFRLFITPRDAVKLHASGAVKVSDCKLNLRQDKAGYGFTIEIPAEVGALLGFDVKIDDASGISVTETVLGGGKTLHRNRCNFSIVKNGKEK